MASGFFEADGDRFVSTGATAGPWAPGFQHGGPPAALMGRAFERCDPRPGMRIARVTAEILEPIPVAPLRASARIVRPGRRVALLEGELTCAGRTVLRATAWRLLRSPAEFEAAGPRERPPAIPEPSGPLEVWTGMLADGYLSAIDWRPTAGSFAELGPGAIWARPLMPLVAGEADSPLVRALLVADSGSGISNQFDLGSWLVINTELTVALHRDPVGEWIHLDARASASPEGSGLAETVLSDAEGDVGRALQTLLVADRPD